jgi:hypothetical protein
MHDKPNRIVIWVTNFLGELSPARDDAFLRANVVKLRARVLTILRELQRRTENLRKMINAS